MITENRLKAIRIGKSEVINGFEVKRITHNLWKIKEIRYTIRAAVKFLNNV